jgi:phenylacetate-CoA ligase
MQKMLGLRTVVDMVAPGSLPRTDFKARRVVDDRAVFRPDARAAEHRES